MMIVEEVGEVREKVETARRAGLTIGCVPTMGALHAGHISLVEAARSETDFVVVTVFVNPTQFGPNEDFGRYPRPLDDDLSKCREMGVDLVFHPSVETMCPATQKTFVEVAELSRVWEGQFRPTHFLGVTTIVAKLFTIVAPDVAFFGQKDYQQQLLIRKLCDDLSYPIKIRTCPTVRESDGIALSSRNQYLSSTDRIAAVALSQSLQLAHTNLVENHGDAVSARIEMQNHLNQTDGVKTDYATIVDPESLEELTARQDRMVALVAANIGSTRLIDNMLIELQD
jgi:pantoate--beta-alanine ligase